MPRPPRPRPTAPATATTGAVPAPAPAAPRFRSAAVAGMAHMPVATLRIWEQRYGAVQPATAASGYRLYTAADVQRVLLLRQLTTQGHAIGAIAGLATAQLAALAGPGPANPAGDPGVGRSSAAPAGVPLRVAVVGAALALRLQRDSVQRHLVQPPRLVALLDSLDSLDRAPPPAPASRRVDLLLCHAPDLQPDAVPALQAVAQALGARQAAVLVRFANPAATQALQAQGSWVLREPADDQALGSWLAGCAQRLAAAAPRPAAPAPVAAATAPADTLPPRRFDDAWLTALAGRPGQLACECPRHVAELLMQLASFEAYSAGCTHRTPADAELHRHLQHVAGSARLLFEDALRRVARHEGLALP